MRLKRLETFHNEFVCFVKATAEDGVVGWGQTSTYNADITAQVFHRQIVPWALGQDVTDIPALVSRIERAEHKFPGSYRNRALAGLDTALWDMEGQRSGLPVAALIGGTAGPVRAYASSMRRDLTPEEEAERLKRICGEQGFTAAKFRIGAEMGEGRDQWPGRTEAIIPAVTRALPGIETLVDANSGFTVARAIEVGHILQDNGVGHYEEPVPWWDLDATKAVADALEVDVTGGEQDVDTGIFARIIRDRVVDVVQPDVMYLGGLTKTLQVAEMAALAGLPVTPHAANLGLVTMATMHLLRALPNAGKYLEFSIEGEDYYPWQRELFLGDPFRVRDGHLAVTGAPGWGLTVNPDWLAKAEYRDSDQAEQTAYAALYHRTLDAQL
ncbi:mandelate racemase/muconate lactonizing enzyme family protein [Pararhodobacter sp. CCB-MM2]|uniref:mandelate racemase/muconate lactonizing enzyme family protein n=1 Tax=Pararhodobacter sp. CCB-MM2 TaxID=1786003 RepID=UPI00082CB2D2|nr:mandelate racemase/muconate lactonizing enzyme family protein [Pararhodobacter sp. CCB-MM2]